MKAHPRNSINPLMLLAALWLLSIGRLAQSATITWTNTSGGNWSNTNNWSPNQVPTNSDTALITTPGTYTVTFDFNANPSSFYPAVTLGAGGGAAGVQTLAMTNVTFSFTNLMVTKGGVLTANGAHLGQNTGPSMTVTNGGLVNCTNSGFYAAVLIANGGSIIGLGNDSFNSSLTVAGGGILNDVTVTIPYGATATVASGGTMNLTAPSGSYGVLDGSLVNSGTINFTNGGFNLAYQMLGLWAGGILNQPGGQLNLNGSVSFFANGYVSGGISTIDTTYLTNKGALTQMTGSGTSGVAVGALDNSQGTITNLSGTLSLGTLGTNLAGVFSAAPGAAIQLYAINNDTTVTVPGSPLVISSGGGVQFWSGILYYASNTVPNLDLRSGLLVLGPAFQGGSVTNLTLDGIRLTNSVTVTGRLNATNGYLNGNITVAGGGAFFATKVSLSAISVASGGSVMAGGCNLVGPVNISAGGGLLLNGTCALEAGLTNSGSVTLNSITIDVLNNPSYNYFGGVQNQPGGVINLVGNGTRVFYAFGTEYFQNRGAITQNSPGGTNSITMPDLETAQGAITNLAGTLLLAAFQTNLAGVFDAAPGAVIQISGGGLTGVISTTINPPLVPGTPLTLAGGGQFQFIGSYQLGQWQFTGGYLLLPTDVVPNLALQGGTLALGANFQGGAITNLSLSGMVLTNTLPVTGTLTVTNTLLYGNFTVASGGVFNCAATLNGLVSIASGGLMSVTNSTGTTVSSSGALTVANGGQFNIIGNSGINLFGALTNAGTVLISNPNPFTMMFSNTVIYFPAGISIVNNPAYNYFGSVLNQASGQINLATDYTGVSGGYGYETLVNQGHITKSDGTNFSYITVALATNSGAITAQSGVIRAYPIAMLPGSSLNVGLNSANNYGSFLFNTNVVLGGAFNATLNNGYVPANGTTFNVLLSSSGVLGTFSSLGLPSSVTWQSTYGSTNFTLVAGSAQPQFGTFNLSGTKLIFNGTGGSPGSNYVVLVSTNLTIPLTNWQALTTNTFDIGGQFRYTNNASPAKPSQFFIFKLP
jgi:hypothetical protein